MASKINFTKHASVICNQDHFAEACTYTQNQTVIKGDMVLNDTDYPESDGTNHFDSGFLTVPTSLVAQPRLGDTVYKDSIPSDIWEIVLPVRKSNPALWLCGLRKRPRSTFK